MNETQRSATPISGRTTACRARGPVWVRKVWPRSPLDASRGRASGYARGQRRAPYLIVLLFSFALTCVAPLLPLLRLGYDIADASHRAAMLRTMVQTDGTSLIQLAKLREMQTNVRAIEHDLGEISGATNLLAAPMSALSPAIRDDQLLLRIGNDLAAAADEGLQIGQTLLPILRFRGAC